MAEESCRAETGAAIRAQDERRPTRTLEGVTHATVFLRGSNVLEYWLAHAEGFVVAPRTVPRERVEQVVVDPVRGRANALIVRSSLCRRRLLPPEAFVAVDPFARLLHLEQRPRQAPTTGMQLVSVLSTAAAHSLRLPALLVRAAAWRLLTAVEWLRPSLARGGRAVWRYAGELGARARAAAEWSGPRLGRGGRAAWRYAGELGAWARAAAEWSAPRLRARVGAAGIAVLALTVAAAAAGSRLWARWSEHGRTRASRRQSRSWYREAGGDPSRRATPEDDTAELPRASLP